MGAWLHSKRDADTGKLPLAAATAAVELNSQALADVAGAESA